MAAGELLDSGFRLFRAALLRCLPWSMLMVLCGQLPRALDLLRNTAATPLGGKDALWWIVMLAGGLFNLLLFALIVLRQQTLAYAAPRPLTKEVALVLRRAPAFVLLGLLCGVPFAVAGVAAATANWGVALLLALPATWFALASWFSVYTFLLDRRGPLAALRDSLRLVRGRWWNTAGVLTVALVVLMVLYALGAVIAMVLAQLLASTDVALLSVITTVVVVVIASIFLPLLAALGHVLYADLQLRHVPAQAVA